MAGFSRIHWVAPAGMICALFAGFVFALGHHLFYASLAGSKAPGGSYHIAGADVSRQQLNTAVGTAFGFLVKSCLVLSISVAFFQAFWRALRSCSPGPTLANLDRSYSVLNDLRGLADPRVWRKFPIPVVLALIAWCVPIASIVTPATLSVQSAAVFPPPKSNVQVPNFDFASLDFVAPVPQGPAGFCFDGPSQPVERVAAAVAAQGQILPITPPETNASWALDFWAPSLQCHDLDGAERSKIWSNILDEWGYVSDCHYSYGYLAWTPTLNNSLPFLHESNGNTTFRSTPLTYGMPASVYIATIPQMFQFAFIPSSSATQEKCQFFGSNSLTYTYPVADDVCLPGLAPPECYGQQAWLTKATLLRCDLMNSSYTTKFDYVDGAQAVTIETSSHIPIAPQECISKVTGSEVCTSNGTCSFGQSTSRLLSYQSIAYAFNQLVLGSITEGGYNTPFAAPVQNHAVAGSTKRPGLLIDSNIVTTVLMDTTDLAFVVNFNGINQSFNSLQLEIDRPEYPEYHGMANKMQTGSRGDLKSALEELFQNITISLLTEQYLLPNYSSPFAPSQLTEVTFNRYHNVYTYSVSTLWAAYGLAILFSLLALGLGMFSFMLNNGSYSDNFSTILRVSRAAHLSNDVLQSESDGKQPLPNRLATTRMTVGNSTYMVSYERAQTKANNDTRDLASNTSLLLHDMPARTRER